MLEAMRAGYEIPNNLSLASFDDFELMSELPIPITTVGVPSVEIGRTAAQMILAELAGTERARSVECDAQIIIRASSGPPPRTKNTR
jgi:LacI family transcriptional regulator